MGATASRADATTGVRGARRSGYLPSFDGWRALAIVAVLMAHDEPWSFRGHSNAAWHEYGGLGVFLFFAISGLLVCTRILEDEALLGQFRVRDFYIRRLCRIQPAALVYVATIALLSWLGIARERVPALLGALFLYQNYLYHVADTTGRWFLTGHFWTLSVEEHFYLLLSALMFWFRRGRVLVFAACVAGLWVWTRAATSFTTIYDLQNCGRYTEFLLRYLMVPAMFALLLQRKPVREGVVRTLLPWVAILGTVVVKEAAYLIDSVTLGRQPSFLNWMLNRPPLLFFGFGFWVVATMLHPQSLTTRLLEWAPLRFVGRLSYSLYLWHPLFFIGGLASVGLHAPRWMFLTERPWRYVATFGMALLSFYLVEKPMIRLGHRLAPPATPGHRDLTEPGDARGG